MQKKVPTCPLCNQIIEVLPSEDINRKVATSFSPLMTLKEFFLLIEVSTQQVNRHIDAGCPKVEPLKTKVFACSIPKCQNHELQKIVCPFCNQQFCIRFASSILGDSLLFFFADSHCAVTSNPVIINARSNLTRKRIPSPQTIPPSITSGTSGMYATPSTLLALL